MKTKDGQRTDGFLEMTHFDVVVVIGEIELLFVLALTDVYSRQL
jgi:hypothetical protein